MAKAKKVFRTTEVMALVEDLRSDFRVVAEQQGDIKKDTTELKEKVGRITEDVAIIKASLPHKANQSELEQLDKRVTVLEAKVL